MTNKMREYLTKQCGDQEDAEINLMYAISQLQRDDNLTRRAHELFKLNRYIRHAILESDSCDNCRENGLVE